MVYITADDLDYVSDINEIEDAVSRFNNGECCRLLGPKCGW